MKTKTGLLALGLFTLSGVVVVSCGGSSGDDTSNTTTGGTSSTTGGTNSTTGGTANNSSGTANNSSGTANNTGGTANNNGGTTNGGTTANGGRNQGGRNQGGNQNAGGDPGGNAGGAPADGCPATMPADGSMCMQAQAGFQGCDYGTMNCRCRRAQGGQMRTWQCMDAIGAGGAGPFGNVTCPANAMDGNDCTGFGACPGQQGCACFNQNVICQ